MLQRGLSTPLLLGVVVLILGSLLVILAVPRFVAALVAIPGDAIQFELARGRPVNDPALLLLIENRTKALNWLGDPEYYRDTGAAAAFLAFHQDVEESASALLKQSETALLEALRSAPVDPSAWARLAYVRQRLGAPASLAAGHLSVSLRTGRYDPGLLESRLRLALTLWHDLPAQDRRVFMEQIQLLWRQDEKALAQISLHPAAYGIVVQALEPNEEAVERLRTLQHQLRKN